MSDFIVAWMIGSCYDSTKVISNFGIDGFGFLDDDGWKCHCSEEGLLAVLIQITVLLQSLFCLTL